MPTGSPTTRRSAPACWPVLTPARGTERRLPGISGAATNSTAPWPGTQNPTLTRSNRITRRYWRPLPEVKCGPKSRTIDERSGASTWNRGPLGSRNPCDDFNLEYLEIARHRAVYRALSRDLDQAHPLVSVQIALQRDLLDDPLGFLADQLAILFFGDDDSLVASPD